MYKVEKYITNCISSILNQTYKKIELILINDGSPDNAGLIADNFASIDNRIKVLHTENKGVSHARNLGIQQAIGKYVVFVDGDDYLHHSFVEYMLNLLNKTKANVAMSRNCRLFPSKDESLIENDKIEIYSSKKAAIELLYPGLIEIGCWNKMFDREFLLREEILFQEKFYMGEGLNFIVKAAEKSNYVAVGNKKVYNYRKNNPNSATTVVNIKKYFNAIAAIDNIEEKSSFNCSEFTSTIKLHRLITMYSALYIILYTKNKKSYSNQYKTLTKTIRKNIFFILKKHISLKLKISITLYCLNPFFAVTTQKVLGKLKRKIRI